MSDIISSEYRQAHAQQYSAMVAYRRELLELQRLERMLVAQQRIVEQAREQAERTHLVYCEQIQAREGYGSNPTKKRTYKRNTKTS